MTRPTAGTLVVVYPFVTISAGAEQKPGDPPRRYRRADHSGLVVRVGELTAVPKIAVSWRTR